ncbi:MAG: ABC transporter permease [Clostridia bacterium]|nr:ABC transporter permease [Clostridia bacterium]
MKYDYSKEYVSYIKKNKIYKIVVISIQILVGVGIFVLWEILAQLNIIDSFIMSSPSKMYNTLILLINDSSLFYHSGITLLEALVGFTISTTLGTIIAIILWSNIVLQNILEPYLVILNSLPKIALGPIIIIWVGIGIEAIITMDILIMIVITILTMLNAFMSCDKQKILLLKSMNASSFQILTKLIIPNAIPEFVSLLKINVGLTWVGTIMGEYLVSRAGLGYLIIYGGQVFNISLVMTSTVMLCVLATIMYFIVSLIEKIILKHYK